MKRKLLLFVRFLFSKILNHTSKKIFNPSLGFLTLAMFFAYSYANAITYYSKATGDPSVLSNWGINTNGGGTAPTTFANSGDIFIVRNGSTLVTTNLGWTIGASLQIANGGTLNLANTSTKIFNGDVAINTGGVWNETANSVINFGGNLTNDGTFTANNGIHTFLGTGKTIGGNNTIAIPNLTISGTTSNIGTLTVSTALAGTSTITNTGTLNFGGSTIVPTLDATSPGNTINYNGTSNQTVKSTTYSNLIISGSSNKTAAGNLTVNGDFTLSGGTFVANNATSFTHSIVGNYNQTGGVFDFNGGNSGVSTVNLGGNFTNSAGAGSITTIGVVQNGILNFNGTGIQTLTMPTAGAGAWVKYYVNATSTLKLASNFTLSTANTSDTDPWMGELNVTGTIDFGTYNVSISGGRGTSGTAKFILNSGGTLITANAAGIDGSIPVAATMLTTYNSGANYIFGKYTHFTPNE